MRNMFFSMFPGRKFDKNGELIEKRTQWSEPAIKMFQEKAKCLVEQFSQYKVLNKFHVSSKRDYLPALYISDMYRIKGIKPTLIHSLNPGVSFLRWTVVGSGDCRNVSHTFQ